MMLADTGHIHHRLVSAGMTQRQAVIILYAIGIVLGIIAFTFTLMLDEYAAVVLGIIGVLGGFTAKELNVFGTSRRRTDRETQIPEPVHETELVER
jgi:UDP-GlcNAc:undecaprenyl-phosphate GlcNAc-1-phosphate transferase